MSPISKPDVITCLNCGHPNPLWNITCEKCYKKLATPDGVDFSSHRIRRSRPGCVTAYAILLFLGAGLMALGGIVIAILLFGSSATLKSMNLGASSLGAMSALGGIIAFLICSLFVVFYIVLGWGLWNLKNWARILVIIIQSLGLCGNIFSIIAPILNLSSNTHANPLATLSGGVFGLVLGGIIIYWFGSHGEYFN